MTAAARRPQPASGNDITHVPSCSCGFLDSLKWKIFHWSQQTSAWIAGLLFWAFYSASGPCSHHVLGVFFLEVCWLAPSEGGTAEFLLPQQTNIPPCDPALPHALGPGLESLSVLEDRAIWRTAAAIFVPVSWPALEGLSVLEDRAVWRTAAVVSMPMRCPGLEDSCSDLRACELLGQTLLSYSMPALMLARLNNAQPQLVHHDPHLGPRTLWCEPGRVTQTH